MSNMSDAVRTVISLLRRRESLTRCEAQLLTALEAGSPVTHSARSLNLPASQLVATFSTRRDLELSRRVAAGRETWVGLESLLDGLIALEDERPFSMNLETEGYDYVVFLTESSLVGVICSAVMATGSKPT
jgi:hypothetical protein